MPKRSGGEKNAADPSRVYLALLGERVRGLRERQGMTLKSLAQLSGLSDRFIIEVEKGNANPSLTSIFNLAHALKSSLTDFLPQDNGKAAPGVSLSATKILSLLENRPKDQISRVLACVSDYLEHAKGAHIALVGMRGAGKTTVGRLLAQNLQAPFYELDDLIELETGLSLGEIFDLEGENYYRSIEEKVLQRVLKKPVGVIAAGGGLVMSPANLLLLKLHCFVVWLEASPEALIARVRAGKDERRLSSHPQVKKQLEAILERRTPYYARADLIINTTHKAPEAISKAILQAFERSGDSSRKQR